MLVPGLHVHTRAGGTQCIYYLAPRLPWRCSPGRLVMVVLLFAEIQGGSKTKQAARAREGPPRGKNADSCPPIARGICDKEAVVIKTKKYVDASLGEEKNKPAEAPGSGDSASRLSCTGKPATEAGRVPLLGISGTLAFSPRRECGRKTEGLGEIMSSCTCWWTPRVSAKTESELNPYLCTLLSLAAEYCSTSRRFYTHKQGGAVAQISREHTARLI